MTAHKESISQTALFAIQVRSPGGNFVSDRTLPARLTYKRSDPLAVQIAFAQDGVETTWVVGRDLLAQGLVRPAGDGDVRVQPEIHAATTSAVRFSLYSPTGIGVVWLPTAVLRGFLNATYQVVGSGAEAVDVDAFIAQCLEGAA